MQICRELAGYSFAHADIVRRAMAKKKSDVMEAERAQFKKGAEERGVDGRVADKIFDEMVSFASYAFNKSHAAAYAVISYRTAYLKTHYPREYMAALMTSVLLDTAKLGEYIAECQRAGIAVLAPDINESDLHFSVSGDRIRFGLLAIKNVGRLFVEQILRERKNGPFKSFEDFVRRMAGGELNRRQVEALIKCGAFDGLGVYRSRLLAAYEQILENAARVRSNLTGQFDLFSDLSDNSVNESFQYPDLPEFNIRELLMFEKESAGMSFSGHLLDDYSEHVCALHTEPIASILQSYSEETGESELYEDKQRLRIAGIISKRVNKNTRAGEPMAFVTLEDRYGEMELVVFPKLLDRFATELFVENAICADGSLSLREGEAPKLLLSSVIRLESNEISGKNRADGKNSVQKKLYVKMPSLSSDACRAALALLRSHAGETPVLFYGEAEKRYVSVKETGVQTDASLLAELRALVGDKNVVLQ